MELKLTSETDLDLSTGNLVFIDGLEAIRQDINIRLRFFKGEWFLNTEVGIPYFQKILGQKPRLNVIRDIYRTAILGTPGILAITALTVDFDRSSRKVSISFRATTSEGPLEYKKEFIL